MIYYILFLAIASLLAGISTHIERTEHTHQN